MDVLEILFEIFGDVILQFVLEALGEVVSGGMRLFGVTSVPDSQKLVNMIWSGLGFLACGGIAGYWSSLLVPHPVLGKPAVSGASATARPSVRGAGDATPRGIAEAPRRPSTHLATIRGGALFAFAMALVRWWMVGAASTLIP